MICVFSFLCSKRASCSFGVVCLVRCPGTGWSSTCTCDATQ